MEVVWISPVHYYSSLKEFYYEKLQNAGKCKLVRVASRLQLMFSTKHLVGALQDIKIQITCGSQPYACRHGLVYHICLQMLPKFPSLSPSQHLDAITVFSQSVTSKYAGMDCIGLVLLFELHVLHSQLQISSCLQQFTSIQSIAN